MKNELKPKNSPARVFDLIRHYLGAAPHAIKNHLNGVELSRIVVASISAGGGMFALLETLLAGVGTIFPAPTDAALAALILTAILEAVRRLGHGADLASPASRNVRIR